MEFDELYSFVFRGILTEQSLDAVGRERSRLLTSVEIQQLRKSLNFDLLDEGILVEARRMAQVYIAIHSLENMIRDYVAKTMSDEYGDEWWNEVPTSIQRKVAGRMDEDEKLRWHSSRGKSEIMYSDFSDLFSIINGNWKLFEETLISLEWTKQILTTLEKSRNIVMHGGVLDRIDIERIGINIRDWLRQAG